MKLYYVVMALALTGCAEKAPVEQTSTAPGSADLSQIVQTAPAPQAIGVAAARAETATGEPVVMSGRIKDFIDGAAVFTMVDSVIPACNDIPGDECETPWDYCCEPPDKLAKHSATVKVVGADNSPLMTSLKGVQSIDHLTTVTVEGKAERDPQGNLTVSANRIYVNTGK